MGPDWPRVGHVNVRMGAFLPRDDLHAPRPLAVLGSRAKEELFGASNPLGQRIDVIVDALEVDATLGQQDEELLASRAGGLLVDGQLGHDREI